MDGRLIEQWREDERASFKGWDFSYIEGRKIEEKPGWDYVAQARQVVEKSNSILDIATGGGEMLASLGSLEGKSVVAIEGYEPNVVVAEENLAPLGVRVMHVEESKAFPFDDEVFDLALNRHGWLNLSEIYRVLEKGGIFLTQQVSGDNLFDLLDHFNESPNHTNNKFHIVEEKLSKMGMEIDDEQEWEGMMTFKDVGALVYYLKAIPWIVDGFSVDTHRPYLEKLQEKIEKEGEISFTSKRFLVRARKR